MTFSDASVPVYVDVEEGTYCIDINQMEVMISERTKAVCIPNLVGNVPDWDRIAKICKKRDLAPSRRVDYCCCLDRSFKSAMVGSFFATFTP